MNRKLWINVVMAMLVAGLFLTVSCAKKTVVSDATTIEDQAAMTEAEAAAEAEARKKAEAERIRQQELEEQKASEAALEQARQQAAKTRFLHQNIHFAFDSSALSSEAKERLKQKAQWLKENPNVSVTIEGHCDERGTTEYNLALGERRASAVESYLQDLGIGGFRMDTVSFGEERPLDPGQTEAAYAKNRRAQFVLK
ncbi:MAG: peptidoglycan-associated lipoprotein Pal [Desulfotignum sp.]|jgi:peptidoglycan-associated lipoprotein|nr:peptidoglycan-associated lipoprotein Pal [Desulfotignum sp.]